MNKGTVKRPGNIKKLVFLVIITFTIIGLLLLPAPEEKKNNTVKEKTWGDVAMKFFQEDTPHTTSINPTQIKYRLCWEDPRKKELEPCTPKGERKYGILVADIKEYHSAMFVFTTSWKENGKFKERALSRWDKIANPKYGTWHQNGSKRKDQGRWHLKKVGNMFVGWNTGKNGVAYPMTLTPM